jgi:hypothetical protein
MPYAREHNSRAYYSRRHYERLSNGGPDTPEQVAWRIADRAAGKQAIAEREARFPQPWADPLAVMEWQRARQNEICAEILRAAGA